MNSANYDVLIVGGGHAGAQVAIALRQRGMSGSIAIVGEEPEIPYERPPLSKDYLGGKKPFERILIRPAVFWQERKIDMLLGRKVVVVDPTHRVAVTAGDERIGYRVMVWAAGGHPRRLTCSGHDLVGVHGVRSRADVDQMISELDTVTSVAVIGGGYIGLEAAAVLTQMGKTVTVLEAQDRVLARVAGETMSRAYEAAHRSHGVDIRLATTVECIEQSGGRATGVRLSSGEVIRCDMVIVGIGIIPSVEPLLAAGAAGENGVAVDAHCRTSLPDVFAIGDCAAHENAFAAGRTIRLESVQNANDQAVTVAKAIMGTPERYHAVPWFWSNQYEMKLQTVGLSMGYDEEVVRGDPASESFSVVYLQNGRVLALDCVNAVRDYVQGKALIGTQPDVHTLSDPEIALKTLVSLGQG